MPANDSPGEGSGYLASDSAGDASSDMLTHPLRFRYLAHRRESQGGGLQGRQKRPLERAWSLASSLEDGDAAEQSHGTPKPAADASVGASDADDEGDVKSAVQDIEDLKDFVSVVDAARSMGLRRTKPIQFPGPRPGTEEKSEFPEAGKAYIPSPKYLRVPSASPDDKTKGKGKAVDKPLGTAEKSVTAGEADKSRKRASADSESSGNVFHLSA